MDMKDQIRADPETNENLLFTKLDIPVSHSKNIVRKRLIARLNQAEKTSVILVTAPPGFGKTTLISDWVQALNSPRDKVAWVTFNEEDNNSIRFWRYITTALTHIYEYFRYLPDLALFPDHKLERKENIIALINEISTLPFYVRLVLDDYHWITDPQIHSDLCYLVEHQPQNFQIILCSRVLPILPLAQLRAKNRVVEISNRELAFNQTEIAEFLYSRMNITISDDYAQKLFQFTEGWITGVQLAGLTLQKQSNFQYPVDPNPLNHSQIYEYLTEEVLSKQEDEIREFLIKTSIVNEFCASLCDTLLDRTDSDQLIQKIDAANLFISAINERKTWFRYQTSFKEILQEHLWNTYPELIEDLHRKAANWLRENNLPEQAIHHALAIHDLEMAGEILNSCTILAINKFDINELSQWFSHFTVELLRKKPKLGVFSAYANTHLGRYAQTEKDIHLLSQILNESRTQISKEEIETLQWDIESIRAAMDCSCRNISKGIQNAIQLKNTRPKEDTYFYGQMMTCQAQGYIEKGEFKSALECLEEGSVMAQKENVYPENIFIRNERAYIFKLQGQLNRAEEELNNLQQYTDQIRHHPIDEAAYVLAFLFELAIERYDVSRLDYWKEKLYDNLLPTAKYSCSWNRKDMFYIRIAKGYVFLHDNKNALLYFTLAKNDYLQNPEALPYISSELIELQMRIWAAQEQLTSNLPDIEARIKELNPIGYAITAEKMALSEVSIFQNKADQAVSDLLELEHQAKVQNAGDRLLKIYLLLALAYNQLHNKQQAYERIRSAIYLAQPEGYLYPFILRGESMRELLKEYRQMELRSDQNQPQKIHWNYLEQILESFSLHENQTSSLSTSVSPLVWSGGFTDILSRRETDVLQLLVLGNTPKEICRALNITMNTTKAHIKNIYRKTDTHTRLELYQKIMKGK